MARLQSGLPLLTVAVLCLLALSEAYPELFVTNEHANGCTDHPTGPLGDHGKPIPDQTTTFRLSKPGSTTAEAAVCPGVSYDVLVDYGGERRRTLITASAGRFGSAGSLPADPKCPNRAASTSGSRPTYNNTLTLPCDVKVSKLVLDVTSAGKPVDNFHSASTTLPVNRISQCPGSICPGAPPAASTPGPDAAPGIAAAATRTSSAAPAAATTAPSSGSASGTAAQRSVGSAGSSCRSSTYNYACALDARDGATLHYTLDSSSRPPENTCTAAVQASAGGTGTITGQQQYLHILLESPAQGYSGVAFPQQFGQMYPADAVIGYVDASSGKPVVSAYHLTNFSPAPSATNSDGLGWASDMGAARPAPGSNGRSLLCFSRPVDAPGASVVKKLETTAMKLNWVGDSSTSFDKQHEWTHSMIVNVADGTLSKSSSVGGSKLAKQLAHGALMLLAFVVFMPLGALMARHKWIMGDAVKGGIRPGWFHIHRAVQSLAVLLALVGFILALAAFQVPWSNMSASSTPHKLYNAHRVLGVIVIAFTILQVIGGLMRPALTHQRRSIWRKGHGWLGWLALATGVAVVLMGVVMMHDMTGAPYVNWLLPVLLLLGLGLVAGLVAEGYKQKLERRGRYDPHTHSFAPKGTASARSSGTGTPEAEISSRGFGPFTSDKNDAATL